MGVSHQPLSTYDMEAIPSRRPVSNVADEVEHDQLRRLLRRRRLLSDIAEAARRDNARLRLERQLARLAA